jgi:hypothetical protein
MGWKAMSAGRILSAIRGGRHEKNAFDRFAGLCAILAGAAGAAVHGRYDLSNANNPLLENAAAAANLPSQIDPRGLLIFGVADLALFFFA